jgi:hypothetical protein
VKSGCFLIQGRAEMADEGFESIFRVTIHRMGGFVIIPYWTILRSG